MKNYSFSNIAAQDTYLTRKSNEFTNGYRHNQMKTGETFQRIQEIKKKYDTPSRRQRIQSLKKSKQFELGARSNQRQQSKQNAYQYQPRQTNYTPSYLKQSFAVNRLQKSALKNEIDSKEFINLRGTEGKRGYDYKESELKSLKHNSRQEEEMIFSKVREMKESLINNDYMRSSNQGKNTYASKYNKYEDSKDSNKNYDPRVENIDKINSKIKQILNCLAENQKNPSKYIGETHGSYNGMDNNRESAFFGNKSKEGQPRKNYESHFHKNSDVIEKINVVEPKYGQNRPYSESKPYGQIEKRQPYRYQREKQLSEIQVKKDISNISLTKNVSETSGYFRERESAPYQRTDYSISKNYTRKEQELIKTPGYSGKVTEAKSCLRASRSRSQIDSIRKSTLASTSNENNDVLRSGKKLNDEISKIQRKIQELQKEKRKMNIQFTPFSLKNRSSSNLLAGVKGLRQSEDISNHENHVETKIEQRKELNRDASKSVIGNKSSFDFKFKDREYIFRDKKETSEKKQEHKREEKYQTSFFNTKNVESNHFSSSKNSIQDESNVEHQIQLNPINTVRIDDSVAVNEEENINSYKVDQIALKKRTDDGILQRKKRLEDNGQIIRTESLKKLVLLFCEQAKLDENLRNMKIWLESVFESDKYYKISYILEKQGFKMSAQECERKFKVDESQHNPFFTSQGFEGSYEALVKAFIKCQQNWSGKVENKFEKNNLQAEGFTSNKVDLQKKGYIQLEDLVRFLNIESGTFYRNRDIFLIFHRLTDGEKTSFDQILQKICA